MSENPDDSTPDDDELDDLERKVHAPADSYSGVELGPIPIGPDGAPRAVPPPLPSPPATPATFVCLRGPCRHYWQIESFIAIGNPAGTFDGPDRLRDPLTNEPVRMPRQISRACLTHPGTETELTEDNIFACNRWDPLSPIDLVERTKARARYYLAHPEHRDTEPSA